MGLLDGTVAFITGAGRGQGRSHAVTMAKEGADIIAVDVCAPIDGVSYDLADEADLAETVRLVEETGRRIVAMRADVRNFAELADAVEAGVREFGRLDHVVANAGIWAVSSSEPVDQATRELVWQQTLDVNLTGVWHTVEAALPALRQGGRGGSIVVISSTAGLRGSTANTLSLTAYTAAKTALVGLMRGWAKDWAPESIRVNTVHPTNVPTGMNQNEAAEKYIASRPEIADLFLNALPVVEIQAIDVSNAVVYLCADSGRYVTGITLSVDAGYNIR
jgi:SDR family mycofactocin-dependent oxidoreductase